MNKEKQTTWTIVAVLVIMSCALFAYIFYPYPKPLDEQLTAFGRIADSDDLWHQGVLKHKDGDLESALALYTQAIEVLPESKMALLYRGTLHYDQAHYPQAIQDYTQALTIDPEFTWALNARGVAHYRNGDPDAAQADFDLSHQLDPTFIGPLLNQGVIQKLEGNLDEALMLLTRAEEFSLASIPTLEVLENVADIQFQQGQTDKALITYNDLVNYYPDHLPAYKARAKVYRTLGDHAKADADEQYYLSENSQ